MFFRLKPNHMLIDFSFKLIFWIINLDYSKVGKNQTNILTLKRLFKIGKLI